MFAPLVPFVFGTLVVFRLYFMHSSVWCVADTAPKPPPRHRAYSCIARLQVASSDDVNCNAAMSNAGAVGAVYNNVGL